MSDGDADNIVISFKNPLLGAGGQGVVYALDESTAAKVFYLNSFFSRILVGGEDPEKAAHRSYYVQKMMHQSGIAVPEPYEVRYVTLKKLSTLFGALNPKRIALLMERIHGIPANKLDGSDLEDALRQFDEQMALARENDFYSVDARLEDTLYVPEKRKLYIVDLGMWLHPSVYSL